MAAAVQQRPIALRAGVCLAIAGAAGWLALRLGPAEDGYFDSAFYLDGARHLALGDGYVSAVAPADSRTYAPVIRWAPAFSALMAVAIRAGGLSPPAAASLVVGASYVVSIAAVFLLGLELFGRRHVFASLLAAALFAIQPSTLDNLNALLSDLPFAAIALLNTLWAVRLSRAAPASRGALVAFGGALAIMVLARYAGALYIPGLLLALAIAMARQERPLWEIARAQFFIALSFSAGVVVWVVRNRQYGPEPFGERTLQDGRILPELGRALHGAFTWWLDVSGICEELGAARWVRLGTLVALGCVLVLAFGRSRARDGLLFTWLPASAYLLAMALLAARMHFDPLNSSRFWVSIWPLMFLSMLSLCAGAEALWQRVPAALLGLTLLGALFAYGHDLQEELPGARLKRGLLSESWRRAAQMLPESSECRLFVMDARPFMLHRMLGPTSDIPQAIEDIDRSLQNYPAVCLAVLHKRLHLSAGAERQRPREMQLVHELIARGRTQLWHSGEGVTVYRLLP